MIELKLGQRWKWTHPNYEYIVEVVPGGLKVIQVIGNGGDLTIYGIVMNNLADVTVKQTDNCWIYLEGQDKPEFYNTCDYRNSCGA